MERLTVDKYVSEMSMTELANNACFIKDGEVVYRDYTIRMCARDFIRDIMLRICLWDTTKDSEMFTNDNAFDEEMADLLQFDPRKNTDSMVAVMYRNMVAMAELREKLKEYEDAEEQGLIIWKERKNEQSNTDGPFD